MLRFRTLGTLDLRDAEGREPLAALRRPKLVALLGYLAAARPAGFQRRDMLLAVLWPELDTAHARNAVSTPRAPGASTTATVADMSPPPPTLPPMRRRTTLDASSRNPRGW